MDFKNNISAHFNEDENLSEMAPNLFNLKQKNDFVLPEKYFDELPGKVMDKIISHKQPIPSLSKGFSFLHPKPIMATVFSIFILGVFLVYMSKNIFNSDKNNQVVTNNGKMELDSLIKWFDLDERQIAEIMYVDNKNAKLYINNMNISGTEQVNLNSNKTVLFDDILNFLIDENIDESDLLAVN